MQARCLQCNIRVSIFAQLSRHNHRVILTGGNSCQNEFATCLGGFAEVVGIQSILSAWHTDCDTFTTSPLTTPSVIPLPSTVRTIDTVKCSSIGDVCIFATSSITKCLFEYPSTLQPERLSSCICQEPLISAASVCQYDTNKTCLLTSAHG